MKKPLVLGAAWFVTLPFTKRLASASIRRKIFLASLYATIRDINNPEKELVNKLNSVLQLSGNPESTTAPMMVHSFIWADVRESSVVCSIDGTAIHIDELDKRALKPEEMTRTARYFIDHAPKWLRYAADDIIMDDIRRMLQAFPALRTA